MVGLNLLCVSGQSGHLVSWACFWRGSAFVPKEVMRGFPQTHPICRCPSERDQPAGGDLLTGTPLAPSLTSFLSTCRSQFEA